MGQTARQRYTFRQYVRLEEVSAVKHEYLEGQVWAMAGGTPAHAAIAAKIIALLTVQMSGKPCRVFSSDLRVRVKATGLGTYPDVSVVCDRLELDPDDDTGTTVVNPTLIVEVLSPSTEDYDRGEKLEHYQQMESLQEVVLVAHDDQRVQIWRRADRGWVSDDVEGDGVAELQGVGVSLSLAEIYDDPLASAQPLQ